MAVENERGCSMNTIFSERLKKAMDLCGYRQADVLEKAASICKETGTKLASGDLSQYLSGKTVPRTKKLDVLAQVLAVNDDWLLGRDVPMERTDLQFEADIAASTQARLTAANNAILREREIRQIGLLYHRASPKIQQAVRLILMQYAGITIEDMHSDWKSKLCYVPETDCFYTFTSDFGPGAFNPSYGEKSGAIVTLWGASSCNEGPAVLTLQKNGNGWLIRSFQAI